MNWLLWPIYATGRVAELDDFFDKWDKNVKDLNLDNINIECAANPSNSFKEHVTPAGENASKITSLTIEGSEDEDDNDEISSADKNTLNLKKVELTNITFKLGDEIIKQFRYNDVFNFSEAVTIKLNNDEQKMSEVTFDMADQVFKHTDLLCLKDITIDNWKKAEGYVRRVELRKIPFIEKNHLKIQSLQISGSVIDLFVLPRTLERIEVDNCDISCSQALSLPNLQFLKLQLRTHKSNQLTRFRLEDCQNLKELDICRYLNEETNLTRMFDARSRPIHLQTLRIKCNVRKYLTDVRILEIPGLVVLDAGFGSNFSDFTRITKMFRTGTLVIVCYASIEVIADDIVKFLSANMTTDPKRIFIGMKFEEDHIHLQTPFQGSLFSNIVDEKSNYYEFENSFGIVGKAITRSQFLNGCVSVGDESIPFFLKKE